MLAVPLPPSSLDNFRYASPLTASFCFHGLCPCSQVPRSFPVFHEGSWMLTQWGRLIGIAVVYVAVWIPMQVRTKRGDEIVEIVMLQRGCR